MKSNCEYHDNGCWVRPCEHGKGNCALYAQTKEYNRIHKLGLSPAEIAIAMLENHHYDKFQEEVVLLSMGLMTQGRKINWLEVMDDTE